MRVLYQELWQGTELVESHSSDHHRWPSVVMESTSMDSTTQNYLEMKSIGTECVVYFLVIIL